VNSDAVIINAWNEWTEGMSLIPEKHLGDTCGDMKPFGSIRRAGIIPVIEDDARTHCGSAVNGICQTVTEQATLGIVRRDLGIALCRNEIP